MPQLCICYSWWTLGVSCWFTTGLWRLPEVSDENASPVMLKIRSDRRPFREDFEAGSSEDLWVDLWFPRVISGWVGVGWTWGLCEVTRETPGQLPYFALGGLGGVIWCSVANPCPGNVPDLIYNWSRFDHLAEMFWWSTMINKHLQGCDLSGLPQGPQDFKQHVSPWPGAQHLQR